MRKEENYRKDFSSLFDEAYDLETTPMVDSLANESERYINFKFYTEGGLKRIDICYDSRTNRYVAMARPKDSSETEKVEAFLREARLNAALQHPNIVPVYDLGLTDEMPWFTMKFIQGQSLEEVIQDLKNGEKTRYADLNERLDIFLKICEAISYAHSVGILHLDLKPDNIRVNNFGDVVVCDWGLADVEASSCDEALLNYCTMVKQDLNLMTVDGFVKGTVGYMAPEQTGLTEIRKGIHTDIFSLGALLYTLLCFERAFTGKNFEEAIVKTLKCDFPKPSEIVSDIPYSLEAVCLKAMSLNKEDRYQSVEQLRDEIQAYRNGFATGAENASLLKSIKLFYLRHKLVSVISLIVVVLLVILTVLTLNHMSLAQKNAIQLAEKMSLEAEYQRKINKGAAPLFYERARISYQAFLFKDTLKFATSTVELDDSFKDAWSLKGLVHFVSEEFSSAAKAFKKAGDDTFLSRLNSECLSFKADDTVSLPIEQYLKLMDRMFEAKEYLIFGNMVHFKCYSDLSIEDRIKLVKGSVKICHKRQLQSNKFHFSYNTETEHLDVSNNKWLFNVASFQNFPAKSANFSNTKVPNCIGFRSQELHSLDISYTNISNLKDLKTNNLKVLNVAGTGVLNLEPLYGSPLEVIDIRNTSIRSLNFVSRLKSLKEIHANDGQFTKNEMLKLPSDLKLITY